MAGVPSILQGMFATFSHTLTGGVQPTRITIQCAIGEGSIAEIMGNIAASFDGVSVGSYPWFKPGQFGTAVVLTSLDKDKVDKAASQLEALMREGGHDAHRDLDNSTFT